MPRDAKPLLILRSERKAGGFPHGRWQSHQLIADAEDCTATIFSVAIPKPLLYLCAKALRDNPVPKEGGS
jgi:hypothetical protein